MDQEAERRTDEPQASEQLIALATAIDILPRNGKGAKVSVGTLISWIRFGHRGVKLWGKRIGVRFYTTAESLERFSQQLDQLEGGSPPPTIAPQEPAPDIAARDSAKASLQRAGWGTSKETTAGGRQGVSPAS